MSKIIVVGSGYAGISAALELRDRLPETDTVTVVSASEDFLFYPSLIWVVQGERDIADISFPIGPVFEEAGIEFIHGYLQEIDSQNKAISLSDGQTLPYDKLLIAAGGRWHWETVPGVAPRPDGHTISIFSPERALEARSHWQALLKSPSPIVIGVALNASLYGAAYEFALNLDVALRKVGKRDAVSISFVTPEPYLGHFGHDGIGSSRQQIEEAFRQRGIFYETEAQITRVDADAVMIGPGKRLTSHFTMIVPPYQGIEPIRNVHGLSDEDGRIIIDDHYRSQAIPDIFAAGIAVQVKPNTVSTLLPCGVFVPGTMSSEMGKIAARNLAADLGHGDHETKTPNDINAFYVLDSGGRGLFLSLGAQSWFNMQIDVPGPWSHWAKVISERYQMWQIQTGNV